MEQLVKEYTWHNLPDKFRPILLTAQESMNKSLAIQSGFNVGATIRAGSGQIYSGMNVEFTNYTGTAHAEKTALLIALANEETEFESIAVIARKFNEKDRTFTSTTEPTAPCGYCRQDLIDYCPPKLEVIMANTSMDKILVTTLGYLVPMPFGLKDLGTNVEAYKARMQQAIEIDRD